MGCLLFLRARTGVEPTEAGLLMLKRARAIVGQADDLMREGSALRKTKVREVRVAAGPYAAHLVVAPTVARLLAADPRLRFDLRVDHWVKVFRMLKERRVDLAVCEASEIEDDELEVTPMRISRAYVAVRPGHPLAETGGALDFSRVLRWPLAITARLPPRVLTPLLAFQGKSTFVPSVHCEDIGVVRSIVKQSDAVGFFPLPLVRKELEWGELKLLEVEATWLHTQFAILRLKDRLTAKPVQSFIEEILNTDEMLAQTEEELSARFLPARRDEMARATPHINGTSITK